MPKFPARRFSQSFHEEKSIISSTRRKVILGWARLEPRGWLQGGYLMQCALQQATATLNKWALCGLILRQELWVPGAYFISYYCKVAVINHPLETSLYWKRGIDKCISGRKVMNKIIALVRCARMKG